MENDRLSAINHMVQLIDEVTDWNETDKEYRDKKIYILSKLLVDYSSLSPIDVGRIAEAYDETTN